MGAELDLNFDNDLTEAEEKALSQLLTDGHVQLEAHESYTLWNALRDHPEITMAELEPDIRALFSTSSPLTV